MQLFGFSVPFLSSGQRAAAESRKKGPRSLGGEIGQSGTEIRQGLLYEEYNSALKDELGMDVYDRMRKSDGTVQAALKAVKLPVRRAKWFVEPASEDAADQEIADFVNWNLFEGMTLTWDDFLRQALLHLDFGNMVFEKVFEVRPWSGRDMVAWRKFAPRLPRTIHAWQMENGGNGVQQRLIDGTIVNIPMEKLLVFVNEKEGDNWQGVSLLRAAYKHWYYKDKFYLIDAMAFERHGMGIPVGTVPEGATENDRRKAETILKNIRANHQSFVLKPKDMELEFMDMKGMSLRDPEKSIVHHNREITKSVLAQFLELGATDSGSRALSTDQTEVFMQSLESVANNAADVVNRFAIPQLVDMNFEGVEKYPQLRYTGISRVDVEKLSSAYSTLAAVGGIQAGSTDEQYFRELLNLPERDPEDVVAPPTRAPEEPEDEDEALEDMGLSEHLPNIKKKVFPRRAEIEAAIVATHAHLSPHARVQAYKTLYARTEAFDAGKLHIRTIRSVLGQLIAEAERAAFAEENEFKSWRPLTFAEQKVNLKGLQREIDRLETSLKATASTALLEAKDRYIKKLTAALNSTDKKRAKDVALQAAKEYAGILRAHMRDAFTYGNNSAAREMGKEAPGTPADIRATIELNATAIASRQVAELDALAKTAAAEALTKGETVAAAVAAADRIAAERIRKLVSDTSEIVTAGYINHGRNHTFKRYRGDIYALQRSELLDSRTCNYCLSVDGRVIDPDDRFGSNTIFHSRCRGIWVEILQDEEEKPAIEGIPGSLRDRFGDAVNDLIQPKTPRNKKDSLAQKEIERRTRREQG